MARKAKTKQGTPMSDQRQTGDEAPRVAMTVPPGVSPETLARAIWRETVLKTKGEKLDDKAREALWKNDRKQYNGVARRIVGRLNQKARSRAQESAKEPATE